MAICEQARKNHDELFPGHVSTLAVTDPELIETFDNFAFDEVIAESKLDTKTRLTLILAALIGSQAVNEYKVMAGAALNVGVTPVEIKEILYQSVAYVGMARAFDFLHATNEVLAGRGHQLPLAPQSTTTAETRVSKGLAAQKAIFGGMIDEMYEKSPKDLLHIQRFLSANCFGDFYTRTGLDLKMRELVTLSLNNGAIEFWIVDADRKSVTVIRREGIATVFTAGAGIPLTAFGGAELAVDEIFG